MGNKILTQYDVQKEPCYYSPELRWKLHSASFKEKPEDKLTIFLFERKVIEKYPKNNKEQIVELLKKDAMCLQRLRHPHILSVIEALVEERSTLAFATKPVVGTVAQLLENNRHELSNLEMKCGLLDVAEAMQFLHQDAKTAHLGFSPYSIFIDPQGKWLLGGLGFSFSGVQWGQLMDCPFGFSGQEAPGTLSYEPPPRYAAPEMCGFPAKCGLESDMFSMGLLAYELMCVDRQPLLRAAPRGFNSSVLRQQAVPTELYPILLKLLSPNPSDRLTIAAFINSEFFMDVNVRAIRFLEQLNEKDETQRVTFLRGLPKLLQDTKSPLCSQRVMRERVLPRLCGALLFPSLYGVAIPIIINILKKDKVSDPMHFQAKLWPPLKPLFTAKEIPIEVVLLFLKELDLLVGLAPAAETQAVLLPFLLRCLELQEPTILNEVLEKVPYLHKKFEYRQVKDQILPRMLQLLGSAAPKVKVQVLMGLSRIFEIFDKNTIQDVVLPAFEKLTKSDRTPAICMCLLGCYDAMSKNLGHKVTSERILPLIMPLLVEEGLSFDQWETQLSVAKKLLQRVETARRKEYEARKDLQAESEQALGTKAPAPVPEQAKAEPQDFESLLMGPTKASAPAAPAAPAPPPANDLASMGIPGLDKPSVPSASVPAPSASGSGLSLGNGFDPFASAQVPQAAQAPPPQAPQAPQAPSFDPFGKPFGGLGPSTEASGTGFGNPAMTGMAGGMGGCGTAYPNAFGGQGGCQGSLPFGQQALPGPANMGGIRNLNYDPFAECDTGK